MNKSNQNITLIGGTGFIGTNLAINLAKENNVTVVDSDKRYFITMEELGLPVRKLEASFGLDSDFDKQVENADIVYHLASTNFPGNSNIDISKELEANVTVTCRLLDACVRNNVKKVVFISSGGAVYGKKGVCPVNEDTVTYPITSYGIQKLTIEKLLYLYRYQKGLDYRVIRLANPYGPYQRPNGQLGVITTFIYQALKGDTLKVYGDGSVVRDFIYIDDAMRGIINIANGESDLRVFNLGSGKGTSISEVINMIRSVINDNISVEYNDSRSIDVPMNYLDISRYEECFGKLNPIDLRQGILRTGEFLSGHME